MPHWNALRQEVDRRGLSALIPESGEQAAKQMVDGHEHGTTIDNFDPLMGCHNAILANAMGVLGVEILNVGPNDEHLCPLCELNRLHEGCEDTTCWAYGREDPYNEWIKRAVDDAVEVWESLKP